MVLPTLPIARLQGVRPIQGLRARHVLPICWIPEIPVVAQGAFSVVADELRDQRLQILRDGWWAGDVLVLLLPQPS